MTQLQQPNDIRSFEQDQWSLLKINKVHLVEGKVYTLVDKFGVDGSGSHRIRLQLADIKLASL